MHKKTNVFIASFGLLLPGMLILPAYAASAGGNCVGNVEQRAARLRPDDYRPTIRCSSLKPDSKARAGAMYAAHTNWTPWTTRLNTTVAGSWEFSIGRPGATVQYRNV